MVMKVCIRHLSFWSIKTDLRFSSVDCIMLGEENKAS